MAETGHAKNVANFATLISICGGFGAGYDPSNPAILLTALNTKLGAATNALDDVQAKIAPWKDRVANRENIYVGIRKLSTRLLAAAEASGMEQNKVDNVRTYHRQIHGARAQALPPDDPDTPENESQGNSVSHQSYVQIVEAFKQILKILDGEPLYSPNETELQGTTLNTLKSTMETSNQDVIDTAVPLANSRIARNDVLYADDSGLCALAALVKKYVKSVYGADSPQYQQVSGLEFKKRAS